MARRAARRQSRGAVPAEDARIRNEVAALALVAFGVLTLVALFANSTAVLLYWWRSFLFTLLGWGAFAVPLVLFVLAGEMWFGLLRRSLAAPIGGGLIAYTALLALMQHYQRGDVAHGEGAGGVVGSSLERVASGAFGDIGTPIALFFVLLVGVVIAANRTLADLVRPAWDRRTAVTSLRTLAPLAKGGPLPPGVTLPGGTGTRFARVHAAAHQPSAGPR